MSGIIELETLLQSMSPELKADEFVFCTVKNSLSEVVPLQPIATFMEQEGLTVIVEKQQAEQSNLEFDGVFKLITLTVHSSLDAVGLTAAVATKLAEHGISANVVAAFFHDHIFVQTDKAEQAMTALREFTNE
ncbi:ACT domain-containing protein [Pseudoalteromonas phenolica]|uniref:ACT domain-containing protein n=1 Tax=Pseudoalteromonas phenolica TaxID=161398 RepID=UPI00110A3687|nr:ACT domain-containing protein [Pseudoalteromonas phenolica]TMO57988.1 transporter [Pseudoalteromonas phenolica]